MKINGNGQSSIIEKSIIKTILEDENINLKHRTLIAVCFFTAARIGEACQVKVKSARGSHLTFEKSTTKTKKTRQVVICPPLRAILDKYIATLPPNQEFLFSSGLAGAQTIKNAFYSKVTAGQVITKIFKTYGVAGASTHSFRRSVLTHAHQAGATLADLMSLSGHSSLSALQRYLESSDNAQAKVLDLVEL